MDALRRPSLLVHAALAAGLVGLLAAGCAAGPPAAEQDGATATDAEISSQRAIEIARRHADLDFEVREVTAERAVEQGRDVWRVTFRGDPPGPGHPLGHIEVVSVDRRTGELVSLAMS
jgi:hypothetical protein